MFLDDFYNTSNNKINFTRIQASNFAKKIADDFNPLHDIDAKRFCVPGDLLFSIVLAKSGLFQQMDFTFSGMVSDGIELNFPNDIKGEASITDDNNKEYMHVKTSGNSTKNEKTIEALIRAYVEFSGHTFPHILVKLMAENNVMINPARPMVMYESMSIELENVDFTSVKLIESTSKLTIEGKRGNACLAFDLISDGITVGHGKKHMLLSGLREYCQETIDVIVNDFNNTKAAYIK
ncbi:DUF3581 family protein [Pseudocolwellia agarivorans]|uniref:DUF3581 family protein n=1 Tax=Pseudocolwellia agarivorans TaxID=1911682 RepID=UPI0009850002|nr:DUF3581 family protein [Pseudocolwellia agarivorans]